MSTIRLLPLPGPRHKYPGLGDQPLVQAALPTGGMAEDTARLLPNAAERSTKIGQQDQSSILSNTTTQGGDDQEIKHIGLRTALREWARELLALIFSSASLITIIILLIVYQGRPIRNFPLGLTLNGAISILSTAYKASLLYAISSAIGQSKWNWYTDGVRRLDDFERIDETSRGPLGAFRFLYGRTKKTSVVSLAAIVVVLALLIDPFSQQLVQYGQSSRAVQSDTVWTEIFTNIFTLPVVEYKTDLDRIKILQTLNGAMWNNASLYDRKVHCPTGNCTFPPFKTLEWCAKTETFDVSRVSTNCSLTTYNPEYFAEINRHYNLTGKMLSSDTTCGWFLDDNTTPLTTFPLIISFWPSHSDADVDEVFNLAEFPSDYAIADYGWIFENDPGRTEGYCNSRFDISCPPFAVSYVSLDPAQGSVQRMEQSVLTLCATEYDIVVSSGVQRYETVRSQYGRFKLNQTALGLGGAYISSICFTSSYNSDLYPPFPNETDPRETSLDNTTLSFCWGYDGSQSDDTSGGDYECFHWGYYLRDMFGTDIQSYSSTTADLTGNYWNFDGELNGHYELGGHLLPEIVKAKGLREFMTGITAAMNSAWRAMSEERAIGSYIYSETVFEISWVWIILPIALSVSGHIVLICTIRASTKISQGKLWKGSTLASLYHGLQERCIPENVDTVEAMEKAAEATLVELKFMEKEDRMLLSK